MPLSDNCLLGITKCCTVRTQVDHCLIYNRDTDELHVIPLSAADVLHLCDGTHSLRAIADAITAASGATPHEARVRTEQFVNQLIARGILGIVGDAAVAR